MNSIQLNPQNRQAFLNDGSAAIGGAYLRRPLEFNGRQLKAGDTLTATEVESIPIANRRALINLNHIELFPAPATVASQPTPAPTKNFDPAKKPEAKVAEPVKDHSAPSAKGKRKTLTMPAKAAA